MSKSVNPHTRYLAKLAKDCGGNTVAAAKQIGISRQLANDLKTGHRDVGACEKALKWLRLKKVVTYVPFLLLLWAVPAAGQGLPADTPSAPVVAALEPSQSVPSLKLELSIYAALQAADIGTTRWVLRKGGHEANPYMKWADTTWEMALVKGGVVAFVALTTKAAAKAGRGKEAKVMLWVVNGMMAAVIVNNVLAAKRLEGRR